MANRNNFWYICIIVFQDLILPLVNYPSFFSFDLLLFKYRPFPLLQEKKISKIMKLEIIAVPQYEQYHRYIFFILMVWSIKNIVMVVHSSCICPKHSQKQSYRCVFVKRCWSAVSIKLLGNFIEITLWCGYFPISLLSEHLFIRTPMEGWFSMFSCFLMWKCIIFSLFYVTFYFLLVNASLTNITAQSLPKI